MPKIHPEIEVTCPKCRTIHTVAASIENPEIHMNQADFQSATEKVYEEKQPNFSENINVAIVGKVSTGKSSLINAILERDRNDPVAQVGATSGVTTKVTAYRLDDHVLFVDCPGLDDVRQKNSQETNNFLSSIDLGVFVVTGSSDLSQKKNFDDLRNSCERVFVVLNKIDEWDDLEESEYERVKTQWKQDLGVEIIYGTCTKGYDPKSKKTINDDPSKNRGIKELRDAIMSFLEDEGKALLLARNLKNKDIYAMGVIGSAVASVAAEAFIPGSAVYITATQAVAITSLHYLYTGNVLSRNSALTLLPTFAGQSLGTTLFLWAKSVLPPTGVVDVAAAVVASTITLSMLMAVKYVLENGYNLDNKDVLIAAFERFKKMNINLSDFSIIDLKDPKKMLQIISNGMKKSVINA